jgi:hypothetical protein
MRNTLGTGKTNSPSPLAAGEPSIATSQMGELLKGSVTLMTMHDPMIGPYVDLLENRDI